MGAQSVGRRLTNSTYFVSYCHKVFKTFMALEQGLFSSSVMAESLLCGC
jgi:hypothetical protein